MPEYRNYFHLHAQTCKAMKILYALLLPMLILFASCAPVYYAPTPQFNTNFHQKNEGVVAGQLGFNSAHVEGGYAFSNHGALQARASVVNSGLFRSETDGAGGGWLMELGPGYYESMEDGKVTFETYFLGAFGHVNNDFTHDGSSTTNLPTGTLNASFSRLAMQPAIFLNTRIVDLGFSFRFANLHYFHVHGDLIYKGMAQVDYLTRKSDYLLIEPAFTLRLGGQNVKAQFQAGASSNLTDNQFYQWRLWTTLGLRINLNAGLRGSGTKQSPAKE